MAAGASDKPGAKARAPAEHDEAPGRRDDGGAGSHQQAREGRLC